MTANVAFSAVKGANGRRGAPFDVSGCEWLRAVWTSIATIARAQLVAVGHGNPNN